MFNSDAATNAFRHWQNKYRACLITNWVVSDPNGRMSFDYFCRERYTGRLNFELRE